MQRDRVDPSSVQLRAGIPEAQTKESARTKWEPTPSSCGGHAAPREWRVESGHCGARAHDRFPVWLRIRIRALVLEPRLTPTLEFRAFEFLPLRDKDAGGKKDKCHRTGKPRRHQAWVHGSLPPCITMASVSVSDVPPGVVTVTGYRPGNHRAGAISPLLGTASGIATRITVPLESLRTLRSTNSPMRTV